MNHLITLLFYKSKNSEKFDDGYAIEWSDKTIGFIMYNWLQMHPDGKVVVETTT